MSRNIIRKLIILILCLSICNNKSSFFLGHEHDAKSLQGENLTGAASGGDDETETETDAPENQNITGPSTNVAAVLPRYIITVFLIVLYRVEK